MIFRFRNVRAWSKKGKLTSNSKSVNLRINENGNQSNLGPWDELYLEIRLFCALLPFFDPFFTHLYNTHTCLKPFAAFRFSLAILDSRMFTRKYVLDSYQYF